MGQFVIGEGVFTWHANERHTNRYGAVFLMTDGDSLHEPTGYVPIPDDAPVGAARPADRRGHRHPPEHPCWRLGPRPVPADPGGWRADRAGAGRLFCQTVDRERAHPVIEAVGLAPEDVDDRDTDWLDPRALYRVHEQTVRLVFEDAPARGGPT